jgi:hypothetical protein
MAGSTSRRAKPALAFIVLQEGSRLSGRTESVPMPDWTADDIAREIERRRGRNRRGGAPRRRGAEDEMRDWSDADWAQTFERKHGMKADPRFGITRVREVDADGEVLFDGDVHVFHLTGQAYPWQGYAWFVETEGKRRFVSMVGVGEIKSARDAVRVWLGQLAP